MTVLAGIVLERPAVTVRVILGLALIVAERSWLLLAPDETSAGCTVETFLIADVPQAFPFVFVVARQFCQLLIASSALPWRHADLIAGILSARSVLDDEQDWHIFPSSGCLGHAFPGTCVWPEPWAGEPCGCPSTGHWRRTGTLKCLSTQRVADLLSRMTLEEKATMLSRRRLDGVGGDRAARHSRHQYGRRPHGCAFVGGQLGHHQRCQAQS